MVYTVKQLSQLAGVSVRTLHYYDEIGLLKPSFIKENGYRYYEDQQVMKLQQILFFKELTFPLEDIIKIVNSPDFDVKKALEDHKKLLKLKQKKIQKLLKTVEVTLETLKGGGTIMNNNDLFGSFSEKQMEEYKEEAKKRWGHTDAYKQSVEYAKNWTKRDYQQAVESWKQFNRKLGETMDYGFDSPEFQALIRQHHEKINAFYDCSLEMLRGLGNLYATDPRFKKTYDSVKPGLAVCMKKAIDYYCDRLEVM